MPTPAPRRPPPRRPSPPSSAPPLGKTELSICPGASGCRRDRVADSRQVYRGMDIGTAKPTAADALAVPHHLLDLVDPDEPFTLADWLGRAPRADSPHGRAADLPLLVGGTGLYVNALVDGYQLAAPRPPASCAGSWPARRSRPAWPPWPRASPSWTPKRRPERTVRTRGVSCARSSRYWQAARRCRRRPRSPGRGSWR